jgi:aryl-alcohol dehydrogenase-like predicted oxidoreductase
MYRTFGRLGWRIGEIGHGMWGMGGQWKGSNDEEALLALQKSYELGCNYYDTAWIYGMGHSEILFKTALSQQQKEGKIYVGTKIPPKNMQFPGKAEYLVSDVFTRDHIIEYANISLENLGVEKIDLLQLHVWDDSWAKDDGWKLAIQELKAQNLITGFGISINKWEPNNILEALQTDLVDAVQVVYNIFEQGPEDVLLPECVKRNIAVIARVVFDEGSLAGNITKDTKFEIGDWRAKFYSEKMIEESLKRIDKLNEIKPTDIELYEMALKYVLHNDAVSTAILGMRKVENVVNNFAVSNGVKMSEDLYAKLKPMRWNRSTAEFNA